MASPMYTTLKRLLPSTVCVASDTSSRIWAEENAAASSKASDASGETPPSRCSPGRDGADVLSSTSASSPSSIFSV
eukprot:scaffold53827_cov28-Tisochrysis_lutea.AAC.9